MTQAQSGETTRIPLFPLALVLFPGTQLQLHIFEPRYRAMVADVRAADGRFGIILRTGDDERAIPAGYVGCFATIREAVPLGDGRSNILVDAGERFAFERLTDAGTPYYVAQVRPFGDAPGVDVIALADAARRARAAFGRVIRGARLLADEPPLDAPASETAAPSFGAPAVPPPATPTVASLIPADDAMVAFAVAGAIELELAARQRVLGSSDAVERTLYIARLLERAIPDVESRAALHTRARSNGHGPHDASSPHS